MKTIVSGLCLTTWKDNTFSKVARERYFKQEQQFTPCMALFDYFTVRCYAQTMYSHMGLLLYRVVPVHWTAGCKDGRNTGDIGSDCYCRLPTLICISARRSQ